MLERGALSVALSYERALPLVALACALAFAPLRQAALGALLSVVGLWLGFLGREWVITALVSSSSTAGRLGLPGPISCLVTGLALAVPERCRPWLLPPAAITVGAAFAIAIKLNDPSFHDPNFLRGAIAAGAWLLAAAGFTSHLCDRPWFRIAMRIFGSWLIAIGVMLGASILIPRANVGTALPPSPEMFNDPGYSRPGRRPTDADRPPFPGASPEFDPSRQP